MRRMGFFGASDAWTPKKIASLWLRPDLGVVQAGNAVSVWKDQSLNGFNLIQDTESAKPTYNATGGPNGFPCLDFDGGDTLSRAVVAATSVFGASAGTIALVIKKTNTAGAGIPCMWYQTVNVNNMYIYTTHAANTVKFEFGADGVGSIETMTTWNHSVWVYLIFECVDSTHLSLYWNGTSSTESGVVTSSVISPANGTIDIGSFGGAVGFVGSIAEVIWCNSASAAIRAALISYFARYGI